jgi:tRNA(Ser,Leu) C12 N-acetylase TAN1
MESASEKDYDFNILVSCIKNRERNAVLEVEDLISSVAGDSSVDVEVTGIRSLVVAKTLLEPRDVIQKLRASAIEDPWRFQYTLKYVPIDVATSTKLESIVEASKNVIPRILKNETFRITCNRRHSQLHCAEIIKAVAALIERKVDLEKPNKVFQVEILGEWTGLSVLEDRDVLSLSKP